MGECKTMQKINHTNNSHPAFGNKFQLTHIADSVLNTRINSMPAKARSRVLNGYDKLIRKIINSDFDVFVSGSDNRLVAIVSKQGQENPEAAVTSSKSLLFKLGLKNPVKFIETAFNQLAKEKQHADTQEAVNIVLSKKL